MFMTFLYFITIYTNGEQWQGVLGGRGHPSSHMLDIS